MEKKALGKGLQALLPGREISTPGSGHNIQEISPAHILPNRYQPRKHFSEQELAELAESIKQSGIIQPILVRRTGDRKYELIAGERRLRAAKLAKLETIPVLVRNSSDEQSMVLSLVENIQREGLNPIEEARTYTRLMGEFGLTQEQVATQVGKERSSIANLARLMTLPKVIQDMVEFGQLSLGHAKVILGAPDVETQKMMAERIMRKGLSVRQIEDVLLKLTKKRSAKSAKGRQGHEYRDLEAQLRQKLGTRTTITQGKRGGKIVLSYFTNDDLGRIVDVILS